MKAEGTVGAPTCFNIMFKFSEQNIENEKSYFTTVYVGATNRPDGTP
jgi:hypothetical protein